MPTRVIGFSHQDKVWPFFIKISMPIESFVISDWLTKTGWSANLARVSIIPSPELTRIASNTVRFRSFCPNDFDRPPDRRVVNDRSMNTKDFPK
jgi:hypothetical protein